LTEETKPTKCIICGDDTDGTTIVSNADGEYFICNKSECMAEALSGTKPTPIEDLLKNPPDISDICKHYACTYNELRAALSADCVKMAVQEQIEFNRNRRK